MAPINPQQHPHELGQDSTSARPFPGWVLVGSAGLWAADCLRPGCIWTATASIPDVVDAAAQLHDAIEHPDFCPEVHAA